MITDDKPLDELARAWDEIREEYDDARNDAYDRTVLDCAARLVADPAGESAHVWTIGLLMTAPYLAWAPGDGVVPKARAALEAADAALRDRPCEHGTHPFREHEAEYDADLAEQLRTLSDGETSPGSR
ncbi:hypothetical protein [Streptomyces sp. NPDC059894]|uniref:hypothetical protein n=1 Tax=unclassified Streptomyces TaxID=2593676 RepID=UPI00366568C3